MFGLLEMNDARFLLSNRKQPFSTVQYSTVVAFDDKNFAASVYTVAISGCDALCANHH